VQAMLIAIAPAAARGCPVMAVTLTRIKAALPAGLDAAIRAGCLTDNPVLPRTGGAGTLRRAAACVAGRASRGFQDGP
jgi:hypothetical protein